MPVVVPVVPSVADVAGQRRLLVPAVFARLGLLGVRICFICREEEDCRHREDDGRLKVLEDRRDADMMANWGQSLRKPPVRSNEYKGEKDGVTVWVVPGSAGSAG